MGIDAASELADFTNAQEKARQEQTLHETAASLAEQSGALVSEADPEKRRELNSSRAYGDPLPLLE